MRPSSAADDTHMNIEPEHRVLLAGSFKACNLGLELELRPLLSWRYLLCLFGLSVGAGCSRLGFADLLGGLGSMGMRFTREFSCRRGQGCRLIKIPALGA